MNSVNEFRATVPASPAPSIVKPQTVAGCPMCVAARQYGGRYCPECGAGLQPDTVPAQVVRPAGVSISAVPLPAGAAHVMPDAATAAPPPLGPPPALSGPVLQSVAMEAQPQAARPRAAVCGCGNALEPESRFCSSCGLPVQAPTKPTFQLKCRLPTNRQFCFAIAPGELLIGKGGDCDLPVEGDSYVSRHHACIVYADGQLAIDDLNSANGTFVRVRRRIPLEIGDEVVIGTTVLRVEASSA